MAQGDSTIVCLENETLLPCHDEHAPNPVDQAVSQNLFSVLSYFPRKYAHMHTSVFLGLRIH
jgi:hypothetical protein